MPKLLWPPEAAQAPLDAGPGAGDVAKAPDEVVGAFSGLQDVLDSHGDVRDASDVLGRFRRLLRSGAIRPDLQLVPEYAGRWSGRRGRRRRPLEATEVTTKLFSQVTFYPQSKRQQDGISFSACEIPPPLLNLLKRVDIKGIQVKFKKYKMIK